MNKLRYFKPVLIDGKIVHGDFQPIKILGSPPIGRFGHTMNYLPVLNALLVTGGKFLTYLRSQLFSLVFTVIF